MLNPVSMQCVHRDIKLENLLLDSRDAVQVRPHADRQSARCCMKWLLLHAPPTSQAAAGLAAHPARLPER